MSKIAKKPVIVKEGVKVLIVNGQVNIEGPKGQLVFRIPSEVTVNLTGDKITIERKNDSDSAKALSGLTRANIANMIKGVTDGFEKKLELTGVGYRAQANGNNLTLSVGYSHPVQITADPQVTFSVEENVITVSGINKQHVGDTAAKVRSIRPPEPYKGKGIKYQNEYIRRKVGKAAKAIGAQA
ncbi:MAG: 50S ribosomal protein L6 [Candidatus Levybacteria bacterium RIFCSPLOWO2_01_FULL_39_10]|nr:MAG: 50S ribosomal protein L6 [Candidatus Levybacteria bacterium RIFCSPLOWO2_01_FULL_39_10]